MLTSFQAVIHALLFSLTEILPLASEAHRTLLGEVFAWPSPDIKLTLACQMGLLLSLFFHFRHDIASMTSGVLSVICFRKKPSAMDEKMPFLILVGFLPIGAITLCGAWMRYQNVHDLAGFTFQGAWIFSSWGMAIVLLLGGFIGLFLENWSRKTKAIHHWSWMDTVLAGISQAFGFIPGIGISFAGILGGLLRNHRRDSATTFMLHCLFLYLLTEVVLKFTLLRSEVSLSPLSSLSFGVSTTASALCGLFAIQIIQRVAQNQFKWYWYYRIIAGLGWIGFLFWAGQNSN